MASLYSLRLATPLTPTIARDQATPSPDINRRGITSIYTQHPTPHVIGSITHSASPLHTGLTWQYALRGIITSSSLSPEILDIVHARLSHINLRDTNGVVDSLAIPHSEDVGFVPNLPYPIGVAMFYNLE
jgi:hypothetical protein